MTTTHLPQRDRRRRKRLLTLRNFLILGAVLFVVFAGVSIWFEMNPSESGLFDARVETADDLDVVIEEAPVETIDEQYGVDPFRMDAAAREQYLGTKGYDPLNPDGKPEELDRAGETSAVEGSQDIEPLELDSDRDTSRFVIEGGPDGVRVREKKEEPDEDQ